MQFWPSPSQVEMPPSQVQVSRLILSMLQVVQRLITNTMYIPWMYWSCIGSKQGKEHTMLHAILYEAVRLLTLSLVIISWDYF
jgi:hypothetical protein